MGARALARRQLVLALALLAAGCATARSYLALREVDFRIDRAADVRLAGILVERVRTVDDLSLGDGARLATGLARDELPLSFDLHVIGQNPAANHVVARLVRMDWTLLLNGTETISGSIDTVYTFAPGGSTDMAIPIRLNLLQFIRTSGRDAFELAKGLEGMPARPTRVELRAVPTIETPLGDIRYPNAITIVRRTF